jgi:hypothetical protein
MNIEESVTYIKEKIKNKLPEYTETFVDGKPYRINVLQLETRWTEKTAEAIETLLTAYEKEKEKNKELEDILKCTQNSWYEDTKIIDKQSKEIEGLKDSNNKLYSILQENKKQTKYSLENNDKKWENKIKAKIEEQDKIIKTGGIDFNTKSYARCKKEFGQSLLEKE